MSDDTYTTPGTMPPRWTAVGLLAGLLLMPTALCAGTSDNVRISGSSWLHDAPTHIADQLGYFHGPGPTIEVNYQASGQASLQRLLAGEADFALAAATPVARALLETSRAGRVSPDDPVILATISLSSQTHHVLVPDDRGIAAPQDLVGHRVGMPFGTSADFFWHLFASLHDLEPDAVERVNLPPEEKAGALARGDVDAVVTWDPWVYRIGQALDSHMVRFSDRHIYTLSWLLVTTRATARERPELCDRILQGYAQAIERIHRQPDHVWALQGEETDLPRNYLQRMEERLIFNLGLNWAVLLDMEQQLDWHISVLNMQDVARPSPAEYLDAGPLSRVSPERLLLPDIWTGAPPGIEP